MDLAALMSRKGDLEASLKNIEQSFHIVTGHLAEVNYQLSQLPQPLPEDETQVEQPCEPVVE